MAHMPLTTHITYKTHMTHMALTTQNAPLRSEWKALYAPQRSEWTAL